MRERRGSAGAGSLRESAPFPLSGVEGRGRSAGALSIFVALLLATSPAFAQPLSDYPRAAHLATPISTRRGVLLMGSQVFALAAGSAVAVAVGSIWVEDNFRQIGRPDPRVFSASIALALAVNMGLTWLLLPALARVTNDEGGTADVDAVRSELWRRTRWIALVGALFAGVLLAGAVVEKNDFGRGQLAMANGAGGSALTAAVFDLTALFTVRSAANASRVAP